MSDNNACWWPLTNPAGASPFNARMPRKSRGPTSLPQLSLRRICDCGKKRHGAAALQNLANRVAREKWRQRRGVRQPHAALNKRPAAIDCDRSYRFLVTCRNKRYHAQSMKITEVEAALMSYPLPEP